VGRDTRIRLRAAARRSVMKNMDHSPVRSQASTSSGGTGRRRSKKDSLNGRNVTDELDVNSF
jgi:hypothetical protein